MFATAVLFLARVPGVDDGTFDASVTTPESHHWWALAWGIGGVLSLIAAIRPARSVWRVIAGAIVIEVLIFWPLGLIPAAARGAQFSTAVAFWAFAVMVAWSWGRLR